jgi:hypothetical protein
MLQAAEADLWQAADLSLVNQSDPAPRCVGGWADEQNRPATSKASIILKTEVKATAERRA